MDPVERATLPPSSSAQRSARRPAREPRPALRFAAAGTVTLALFVLTYGFFVATEPGQRLENSALRGADLRDAAARETGLAQLGDITAVMFAFSTVAILAVGAVRRKSGLATITAGIMVTSVVGCELLKELLPRPELVAGPPWLLRNSFPSGTVAVAASVAVGAFLVAPDRLRWAVVPVGAVYAAVIVDAVQATGWHRLSDTLGSVLLVMAVSFGGLSLLAAARHVDRTALGGVDRRIRGGMLVAASVLVVLGALLLVVLAAFPLLAAPDGGRRAFLHTAFPLVGAGFTILSFVLFTRVVEPFSLGRAVGGGAEGDPRDADRVSDAVIPLRGRERLAEDLAARDRQHRPGDVARRG